MTRLQLPLSPMSEEQLKAFLEKVKGDTSLQEKLKAAADADAVLAIAIEAGFIISNDDLTKAQVQVTDEELEGATGGCGSMGCGLENAGPGELLLFGAMYTAYELENKFSEHIP